MEKTNTIKLQDHGIMLQDYFGGTSGVMIPITIDNKTTIKQAINEFENECNMIGDHIEYTAQYHGFIGNLDKQINGIIKTLKKENNGKLNDAIAPDLDYCFDTESQDNLDYQEYPVLILSLEFSWEEPDTYTIKELEDMNISKGELFQDMEKVKTFDYALPQQWLDSFTKYSGLNYHLILGTTVWVYPENKPLSLCAEVQDKIDEWYEENI